MSLSWSAWFMLGLLFSSKSGNGEVEESSCLYQFTQQPGTQLNCNPSGSKLQIHCGVTGPLSPTFEIQWYYNFSNVVFKVNNEISSRNNFYIRNNNLDVMNEKRSASSVLLTKEINSSYEKICLWCQISVNRISIPMKSNIICIDSHEDPIMSESCSDSIITLVNTTVQCIKLNVKRKLGSFNNGKLSSIWSSESNSLLSTVTMQRDKILFATMFGSENLQAAKTNINTASQNMHTGTPVALSISKTHATTPSSTEKELFVSSLNVSLVVAAMSTTTANSTGMGRTVPEANFEGALYAAIVICVMFIGVIVVLVVVILCLTRKKCLQQGCNSLRQKFGGRANARENQQHLANHVSASNHVSEQLDGSPIVHNTQMEVSMLDDHENHPKKVNINSTVATEKEFQQTNFLDLSPPELPPKPKKSCITPLNYDNLEPSMLNLENSIRRAESSASKYDSEVCKQKVPSHFYHTLEDDGSGLLHSATASHASSQIGNLGEAESSIDKISGRLQELFDDPRYAMLNLNLYKSREDHVIYGLTKQKDFSRSSPSIVTLLQPQEALMKRGATERRSLKLPRWISTNQTGNIYDN